MLHINYCTTCKLTKEEVVLMKHYKYTKKDGTVVQKYMCRECNNNKFKKWYKQNPARFKKILRKSEKKNPGKREARAVLNYAVRKNVIKKPDSCSLCYTGGIKLEAHHIDYTQPLNVKWLCHHCHSKEHTE